MEYQDHEYDADGNFVDDTARASATSGVESSLRRSTRVNLGVAPRRFGQPEDWTQTRQEGAHTMSTDTYVPTPVPSPSRTPTRTVPSIATTSTSAHHSSRAFSVASSKKSSRSSATVRARREIDLQLAEANNRLVKIAAEKELAKMEAKRAEVKAQVEESDLSLIKTKLEAQRDELEDQGDSSDEERSRVIAECDKDQLSGLIGSQSSAAVASYAPDPLLHETVSSLAHKLGLQLGTPDNSVPEVNTSDVSQTGMGEPANTPSDDPTGQWEDLAKLRQQKTVPENVSFSDHIGSSYEGRSLGTWHAPGRSTLAGAHQYEADPNFPEERKVDIQPASMVGLPVVTNFGSTYPVSQFETESRYSWAKPTTTEPTVPTWTKPNFPVTSFQPLFSAFACPDPIHLLSNPKTPALAPARLNKLPTFNSQPSVLPTSRPQVQPPKLQSRYQLPPDPLPPVCPSRSQSHQQIPPAPTMQTQSPGMQSQQLPAPTLHPQPQPQPNSAQNTDQATFMQQMGQMAAAIQFLATRDVSSSGDTRLFMARQAMQRDLPIFSGDAEEWATFAAAYLRSSRACNFSNDENLSRLQKCLKGKAREMVQAMLVTPENVQQIMSTLEFHFGQPEDIIGALVNKAEAAGIVREDRPDTLLEFSSTVRNLVATLFSLNKREHLVNPMLVKKLLSKLPPSYKLLWANRVLTTRQSDLSSFANWLQELAQLVQLTKTEFKPAQSKPQTKSGEKLPTATKKELVGATGESSAKAAAESSDMKTGKSHCVVCKSQDHKVQKCKELLNEEVDKRWKKILELHLCFGCLRKGHDMKTCPTKRSCGKDGCKLPHNQLLHKSVIPKPNNKPTGEEQEGKPFDENCKVKPDKKEVVSSVRNFSPKITVLLRVAPVRVKGPNGEVVVNALFDDGSTCTLMDEKLAEDLGLKGWSDPLDMQWTHNIAHRDPNSKRVDFIISGSKDVDKFQISNARTMKELDLPAQCVNFPAIRKKWKHLQKCKMEFPAASSPKLLIGQDNYRLIAPREIVEGPLNAPVLSRTNLGWIIHGRLARGHGLETPELMLSVTTNQIDQDTHKLVKDYFSLESFGTRPGSCRMDSKEETRAKILLEATTRKLEERYETGLLWKHDTPQLPESRTMAEKRLGSIERKMDRNPEFASQYSMKMDEFVQKGYARKLEPSEIPSENGKLWYLPHFPVINPNKPGKMRLVFDAAAKSAGISLNDALLAGPDFLTPLPEHLFNFRHYDVAISGDIKEMFPQIKIQVEDQLAQRFLWRGGDRELPPEEYVMTSMIFGAKSSPCSAQYVKNVNAQLFQFQFPVATQAIVNHHYMDNYLQSFQDVGVAKQTIQSVFDIHAHGGFKMCSWLSNSTDIMDWIPSHLRLEGPKTLELDAGLPEERILGLGWDPNSDSLSFNLKFHRVDEAIMNLDRPPTKREFLRILMSIFDPLGMACHITARGKFLLQDIWRSDLTWDEVIPDVLLRQWKAFRQRLNDIGCISLPRCYGLSPDHQVELHIFSDASERGFAAVCYFRFESGHQFETSFVMAKSRVAPLKFVSIPRLELLGAVLAVRMSKSVQEGHKFKISATTFWTDSQIVLTWLRSNSRKFQTFVANRVGEIEEATQTDQWRWVPGELNTADFATRENDVDPELWFHGPRFLRENSSQWPVQENVTPEVEPDLLELKKETCLLTQMASCDDFFRRFSHLVRLHRVMGWVLRFIANCKKMKISGNLTAKEYVSAEKICMKLSQWESGISLLNAKGEAKAPRLKDEDGVIRLQGRLQKSPTVSVSTKHPILLSLGHPYTRLVVRYYHERANHQGQNTVINDLRERFWIPSVRRAVQQAERECNKCKLQKAQPQATVMGQLPEFRTTRYDRPFTITGLDFFGPMEVTIGRRREKRWGALFTCLSVRAVHVELAASLSTDSAIMAIRRFIARRGRPAKIISDNGSNFKGADRELREAQEELKKEIIQEFLTTQAIEWSFIPPYAPHMGGCWERMVGSIKRAFKAVLKDTVPREETLHTVLLEAEAIVNRHPLTDVPSDPEETEALTPSHFLLMQSGLQLEPVQIWERVQPPGVFTKDEFYHRKQWRISQFLADQFWSRWVREYLPMLNRQSKWFKLARPVVVGDVAILADHALPRNCWPKGIVTELHPGADGVVRVVTLKTPSGVYRRPITKICVLDLQPREDEGSPSPGGSMSSQDATGTFRYGNVGNADGNRQIRTPANLEEKGTTPGSGNGGTNQQPEVKEDGEFSSPDGAGGQALKE